MSSGSAAPKGDSDGGVPLFFAGCTMATPWASSSGQSALGAIASDVEFTLKTLKLESQQSFSPRIAKRCVL